MRRRAAELVSKGRFAYFNDEKYVECSLDSLKSPHSNSVVSSPAPNSPVPSWFEDALLEYPYSNSMTSSPVHNSPVPSWWDDVYEAADVAKLQLRASRRSEVVKRALFLSPEKSAAEIPQKLFNHNPLPLSSPQGANYLDHVRSDSENLVGSENHDRNVSQEASSKVSIGQDTVTTAIRKLSKEDVINFNPALKNITNLSNEYCILPTLPDSQDNVIQEHIQNKLYPSHLKIYEAKLALNSGRQHVTSKGKFRQARSVKPSCHENCTRCISPKLTPQERHSIHSEFWNLKDHQKQWEFIKNSLIVSAPKKKFAVKGAKGEKNVSRVYTFKIEGHPRKVCKTMFKNTLCICDSWIDSALAHGCDSVGVNLDKRGKHINRTKRSLNK